MKGMPGTVILHPSLSASTLSTDLDCQGPRTYAAPRIGKPLTLARKQSRGEGGCGGGMPTGCPAWVLMRQSAEQQDRLSGTGGVNKLIVARVHFLSHIVLINDSYLYTLFGCKGGKFPPKRREVMKMSRYVHGG